MANPRTKAPKTTRGIEDVPKDEMKDVIEKNYSWFRQVIKVQSDQECAVRIQSFFAKCAETGEYPTVEKLALALGVDTQQLRIWENRATISTTQERSDMIREAKALISAIDAELALRGKINNITYIFRAKNFYGMHDQTEHIVTQNQLEVSSQQRLLEQAQELPDE